MVNDMKSKVYFTKDISPEAAIKLYEAVGLKLSGNVAAKIHSGEKGNQNFLKPEFWEPMINHVNGHVVECNTAYTGSRMHTKDHIDLLKLHGWTKKFDVDLMDAEGEDLVLTVRNGNVLKENFVGAHLKNYDSMVVCGHFKGHPMGGYGGALKQLSIGCASSEGKTWIHSGGAFKDYEDQDKVWGQHAEQDTFLEAMADAASSVVDFFDGKIVYLFAMCNLSVDCDCCEVAEDPCMKDIGFLASTDPVAIDQACMDLINAQTDDPGLPHFLERVNSRHGVHTIEAAAKIGVGSREYELIEI